MNTVDINNALINMKNALLSDIATAPDSHRLAILWTQLDLIGDLWRSLQYGYKLDELYNHIRIRARVIAGMEEDRLLNIRSKISLAYKETLAHIRRLNEIAGR